MSEEPLAHVWRPNPPWRDTLTTECGQTNPQRAITRDELHANIQRWGKKRTAFTTCMTCAETAERWPRWETDPLQALAREVYGSRAHKNHQLRDELRALAALVDAHRDEFDGYLSGLGDTVSLDQRRRSRRTAR